MSIAALILLGLVIAPAQAATPHADFGITGSVSPNPVQAKANLTVTYKIRNNGPDTWTARARLGGGSSDGGFESWGGERVVSVTTSYGTCTPGTYETRCTFNNVAPGAEVTVTLVLRASDQLCEASPCSWSMGVQGFIDAYGNNELPIDQNAVNDYWKTGVQVKGRPQQITADGVPYSCTSRNFYVRVRSRVPRTRRVTVYVDGRRVASRRLVTYRVRIMAARLRSGDHSLTVLAQDNNGRRLGRRTLTFRRCSRNLPSRRVEDAGGGT